MPPRSIRADAPALGFDALAFLSLAALPAAVACLDRALILRQVSRHFRETEGLGGRDGLGAPFLDLFPDPELGRALREVVATGRPARVSARPLMVTAGPTPSLRFHDVAIEPMNGADGRLVGLLLGFTEVTARVAALTRLDHLVRARDTRSACGRAIIKMRDGGRLLGEACRILVETGSYPHACVGSSGDVVPLEDALAGAGTRPAGLERGRIVWEETGPAEERRGGRSIRAGELIPAGEGLGAKVAVSPLTGEGGRSFGHLFVLAAPSQGFAADELAFLEDLACDLAFGLSALELGAERIGALERCERSLEATVTAVAATIERRDPYTAGHQRRVAELARMLAQTLGLPTAEVKAVWMAAVVHDIGKICLPAEILTRPGQLSAPEYDLIKTHAEAGYDILKGVEAPWPLAEMVRQHHERVDGSGYPFGLRGEEITRGARVLAVADVVEAMACARPYRPALGLPVALREIRANRGRLYDGEAVDACLDLVADGRLGPEFIPP